MPPADRSIHIALCFDDNFWAPAYAVMRSICLFTKRRTDLVFHLCHRPLTPAHRSDLEQIPAEFGARLVWHDLEQSRLFQDVAARMPYHPRLTGVIYARLLIDKLVDPSIARVLYLDCDMMVRAPIEELYEADLGDYAIGAVRDTMGAFITGGRDLKSNRDLFDPADAYFNSGMLLIDLERWQAADITGHVERLTADGTMARLYYDQDFLNLVFQGNWQHLPPRWNMIDARQPHEGLDPAILHYTGPFKPWTLLSNVAFRRLYRHVMTNDIYYRFMRHRWKRRWLKRLRLSR